MAQKIRWAPTAITHFSNWIHYILQDSKSAAQRERISLLKAVRQVARFPNSGRIVPEFNNPALREIIKGAIRIVYRIKGREIHLLAFQHASRPLDEKLFF